MTETLRTLYRRVTAGETFLKLVFSRNCRFITAKLTISCVQCSEFRLHLESPALRCIPRSGSLSPSFCLRTLYRGCGLNVASSLQESMSTRAQRTRVPNKRYKEEEDENAVLSVDDIEEEHEVQNQTS